jgi:hypothetical protein
MLAPVATRQPVMRPRRATRARNANSSAMVMVTGGAYLVDLGPLHAPRFHTVQKDKTCSCGLARCNAVKAVEAYLKSGGQRASEPAVHDPSSGGHCPICGALTTGPWEKWVCTADRLHYWLYRSLRLRAARERWLESLSADQRRYHDAIWLTASDRAAREKFLGEHALTYPAGS